MKQLLSLLWRSRVNHHLMWVMKWLSTVAPLLSSWSFLWGGLKAALFLTHNQLVKRVTDKNTSSCSYCTTLQPMPHSHCSFAANLTAWITPMSRCWSEIQQQHVVRCLLCITRRCWETSCFFHGSLPWRVSCKKWKHPYKPTHLELVHVSMMQSCY